MKLIIKRIMPIFLAIVFSPMSVAYQSSVNVSGLSVNEDCPGCGGEGDFADGGTSLTYIYAIHSHADLSVPSEVISLLDPQSSITVGYSEMPVMENDVFTLALGTHNELSIGGQYVSLADHKFLIGLKYTAMDAEYIHPEDQVDLVLGFSPTNSSQLLFSFHRNEIFTGLTVFSTSYKEFRALSNGSAVLSEIIFAVTQREIDRYSLAYQGKYFWNNQTAIGFSYKSAKQRNTQGYTGTYGFGFTHYLSEMMSFDLEYLYEKDHHRGVEGDSRTLAFSLTSYF